MLLSLQILTGRLYFVALDAHGRYRSRAKPTVVDSVAIVDMDPQFKDKDDVAHTVERLKQKYLQRTKQV